MNDFYRRVQLLMQLADANERAEKAEADLAAALAAHSAQAQPPAEGVTDDQFPRPNSVWIYKNDPQRRYVVINMANVAHRDARHPPYVVYVREGKPENMWVRTVPDFYRVMQPVAMRRENPNG